MHAKQHDIDPFHAPLGAMGCMQEFLKRFMLHRNKYMLVRSPADGVH
jgi:hypothetical protein